MIDWFLHVINWLIDFYILALYCHSVAECIWPNSRPSTGPQWGEALLLAKSTLVSFAGRRKWPGKGFPPPCQFPSPLNAGLWPVSCRNHFCLGTNPCSICILCMFCIIQGRLASDLLHLIGGRLRSSTSGFAPCDFTEMCEQTLGFFWKHIFMENHTFPFYIFTPENFQLSLKFFFTQWTTFHIGWVTC